MSRIVGTYMATDPILRGGFGVLVEHDDGTVSLRRARYGDPPPEPAPAWIIEWRENAARARSNCDSPTDGAA